MKSFSQISKGIFYLLLLPGVMVLFGWQGWLLWNWLITAPNSAQLHETGDDTIQIQIPTGTTGQQLGEDLETAGIIRSAEAWRAWIYLQKFRQPDGDFKAGTYKLAVGQPLTEVARKIWNGEVMQLSFTIPEGWTIEEMGDYFESVGYFSSDAFVEATQVIPKEDYPWLPADLPHLEGFLMPDTYQLASDRVSPQQIIRIMLDQFESTALPVYRAQESQTDLSLLEWATLASIVEKESVVDEERGIIAGVFRKRLDIGMALQADPTVEYGLGIRQTADQPLTYAQVETPSPYNTYINPGLPPTPIAAPGLDSLKATLNPEPTDALYFVARYDGTHVFSETLAAHEAATRAIRRQREAQQN